MLYSAIPDFSINPLLLYVACALGALGVVLAMPRRGVSPVVLGGLIAAAAGGMVVLGLTLRAADHEQLPSVFFYIFGLMALGGGLRMITHPRPVYAALYFILTIVSSSGLYLLLSAEFMAFALVIIYAGAILITYLFVIMLATQAPTEATEPDEASIYDASAREPIVAATAGFVLLALLSTMMFRGTPDLRPMPGLASSDEILANLPGKVEDALDRSLRENGLLGETERFLREGGALVIDSDLRTIVAVDEGIAVTDGSAVAARRVVEVPLEYWPEGLRGTNVEGVGLNLLAEHPITIEIAGVVLLMAILGATVLARKQVDIEEEAKARQARRLAVEGRR